MFSRLGRFAYRRRHAVVAAWAALLLVAALFAMRVDSVLHTTVGEAPTEASQGLDILQREFGLSQSAVFLIFSSETLHVDDPQFKTGVERSLADMPSLPGLARIDTPYTGVGPRPVSADGRAGYGLLWLDMPLEQAIDAVPEIKSRLVPAQGIQVQVTGAPAIFHELELATERDLRRGELAAIPLVLIALLLIFGGVVASGLPVLMGGVSLVMTLGSLFFLGQATDMSIFAKNIASLLALGLAVDYSLFMVSRFREEIARRTIPESLAVTMATAGKAVAFSGATTILGLSGLLLVKFSFLRSLGIGGIVVVLLSLVVALTLVPAVLAILGVRINRLPTLPRPKRPGTFWFSLAHKVMARPVLFFFPSAALLVALGLPFLSVRLGPLWAGTLPEDAPARRAWEFAEMKFGPGVLTPLVVVVETDGPVLRPDNIGALHDYSRRLAAVPGVEGVDSIVDVVPGATRETYQLAYSAPEHLGPEVQELLSGVARGSFTFLRVRMPYSADSEEAHAVIERVRAVETGPRITRHVTGAAASLRDSIDALYEDFPKVASVVVGGIYLALLVLFRSVVIAAKAVVMNGLSILACFGALVYVFQQGHFEEVLGFRAHGAVEASLPILLFCMVFGLSMDYGLFLLSRVKEEYDRTGDNAASIALGMERSGKIITSASVVVIAVGFAFALGDVVLTKALGLGLAIAVLIDATIVRALLVPSAMRLLGKWNWWAPRPLLRILPVWEHPSEPAAPGHPNDP